MIELSNPHTLGSLAAFRQAVGLLRQTSRAGNTDWYRQALDLDLQWHVVVLGTNRVHSVLLSVSENVWLPGPKLSFAGPVTAEALDAALDEILAQQPFRKGKSLGVILHVADEFATTEILSEFKSVSSLEQLREEVLHTPATVLGDPSLSPETTSTRVIPYAGAQRPPLASTVTLSRQHEVVAATLRALGEERNFPVMVQTVSAPLALLAVLPAFLPLTDGRPHFVLLHYNRFSALAVFNGEGNLLQLRALPHRGRLFPSNLGDAINTALDALDLTAPAINILPLGEADPSPLLTQLHATLNQPEAAEMRLLRPAVDAIAPEVPDLRPEMLVAVPQYASSEVSPGFKQLYGERWALQDFFPVPEETTSLYPTQTDMRLLRFGRVLLALLAFSLVGVIGYGIFAFVKMVSNPAYRHNPESTAKMNDRMVEAGKNIAEFQHWDNLLQERSKGWLAMELLVRLFPEDSGIMVTKYTHNVRLDAVVKDNKAGFNREWSISGFANNAALPLLANLNSREGMNAIFKDMKLATGNEGFNTEVPGRNLVVSLERAKNSLYAPAPGMPKSDKRVYPYSFELKISQSFGSADPMAIGTKALLKR